MQAKIIDFASDRIAKSLSKINKEDVRSAYSTISSKLRKKPKEDLGKVSSSEEYCEMMKKEFTFPLDDVEKPKNVNNKKPENVEAAAGATDEWNTDGKDFPLRFKLGNEWNKTKQKLPDEKIEVIDEDFDVQDLGSIGETNRSQSGEVQSFVQKKNLAQGMMDLALVSANCNQLRYVLDMATVHPYFLTSLVLILCSLTLQVMVGLILLYSNR